MKLVQHIKYCKYKMQSFLLHVLEFNSKKCSYEKPVVSNRFHVV